MILETSRKRMKIRLAMPKRSCQGQRCRCLPKEGLPLQKKGKTSPGQQGLRRYL